MYHNNNYTLTPLSVIISPFSTLCLLFNVDRELWENILSNLLKHFSYKSRHYEA